MSYIGTSDKLSQERGTESVALDSKTRTYDYDSEGERLGYERTKPNNPASTDEYRTYEKDANGSVVGLEQNDGAIADNEQYAYDPYGELRKPDLSAPMTERYAYEESETLGFSEEARDNPFRFEGHYYDSGVKLYDMGARSYRPDVGRFLSQDRYEAASDDFNVQTDPLTQSRYAFAGGNPINNVEWDGHHTVTCLSADHCSYAYDHWRKHHPKPKPPKPKRKKKQEVVIVATSDQRVVAVVQSNGRVGNQPALVSMDTLRQHGDAQVVRLQMPLGEKKKEEKKDEGSVLGGIWQGAKELGGDIYKASELADMGPRGWIAKAKLIKGTIQFGSAFISDPGGTLDAMGAALRDRYSGKNGLGLAIFDGTLMVATGGTGALAKGSMTLSKAARSVGTIRNVNPPGPGRTMNCASCAIATDATLAGRPSSALPGGPWKIRDIERHFGRKFAPAGSPDEIAAQLSAAGPGARGIVWTQPPRGVGHVFNGVNQGGTVRFLDGQSGGQASFENYSQLYFMRTDG
jgi:RHS repeat-associated protein